MLHYADLHRIEEGFRFCTCCGRPEIAPEAPAWKTLCRSCYQSYNALSMDQRADVKHHCTHCSAEIPQDRVRAIALRGGRVYDCADCSRDVGNDVKPFRRAELIDAIRASVPSA